MNRCICLIVREACPIIKNFNPAQVAGHQLIDETTSVNISLCIALEAFVLTPALSLDRIEYNEGMSVWIEVL